MYVFPTNTLLFVVFVLYLHVCGDQNLATHMHILHKYCVLVLRYVGGGDKVEKELFGGSFPCRRGDTRRKVVHTFCGPRSTLASGMSHTDGHTAWILGYSRVKGV